MFSKGLFESSLSGWHLFGEFLIAAVIVIISGSRLTGLADRISDELQLAKGWVGALLLATVTSMPEVVASGTSVLVGTPDLAFGNIFGSCCFNLALITILNGVVGRGSILSRAESVHTFSASYGVILLAMGLIALGGAPMVKQWLPLGPLDEYLGMQVFEWSYCGLIALTYLCGMRMLHRLGRDSGVESAGPKRERSHPKEAYVKVALWAVVIIISAIWMTKTGDVIAQYPFVIGGKERVLGATFVGAFFLAIATSLPEVTTGIAAVRIGQLEMALGNIFGSNMFNVFVIPIAKCFTLVGGSELLFFADDDAGGERTKNILAASLAMLLTGIVVVSLISRGRKQVFGMGADSVLIGIAYLLGMLLLLGGS
jgi:cation:H+ antiporter